MVVLKVRSDYKIWVHHYRRYADFSISNSLICLYVLKKDEERDVPMEIVRENSPWAIKKRPQSLCESLEKFYGLQRHYSNFFLLSIPLPSDWALTVLNCRCEKSKIPLSLNISLIFFEHLNDFKWKNSKLESCRSRRDL